MLQVGDTYQTEFTISQEQVNQYAVLSGDNNPLHIDAAYAATTNFKSPIVHGIFTSGIISRVLGTEFPGEGTFYLGQQLDFKRAIYPDKKYIAKFIFNFLSKCFRVIRFGNLTAKSDRDTAFYG